MGTDRGIDAARSERDAVLPEPLGEALDRTDHVGRVDLGAAAALELGSLGPPSDHREPRRGRRVEGEHTVVGEEHDRFGRRVAGDVLGGLARDARRS